MKKRAYTLIGILLLNTLVYGQEPAKPAKRAKRTTSNPRERIQRRILAQMHISSYLQAPEPYEVEMFLFEMDRTNPVGYFGEGDTGGSFYEPEPYAETEKCKLAKSETNQLLLVMSLGYAESLVSCGAVFIPWLGGISLPTCLFVSAGTMATAWAVVNAAKKQRLECRGY